MAKKSKSARIRELLNTGMTAQQIAAKVKCAPATVYSVKWQANKKAGIAALHVAPMPKGRRPARQRTGIQQPASTAPLPIMQDEARILSEHAAQIAQQAEYHGSMLGGGYTMPAPQVQTIAPPEPNPAHNAYMKNYPTGERGALYNTMATPRGGIREFSMPKRTLWERVKDFFRG